jgi:hypothetical protein
VENADVAVEIIQKARDNAKIRLNVMERWRKGEETTFSSFCFR